jgi:WD40 repeat protein/predicted Ser/Thr protein kinase
VPDPQDGTGKVVRYFGDYELAQEIGRGGMGVVYRARQTTLDRLVAVKLLPGAVFADPQSRQRFRDEARAAAQLQHPNIVAIHEVGEHGGQPYFSMDFVEGRTLAALIRDQPPTARESARLLLKVAQAIHYAHQRGILHRDLKPSNILIDALGQPRVTDFGLAKRLDSDEHLTQSGQTLGSPNYIPPEQISAKRGALSPRSDLYSLGAVFYHLLAGRPPFVADSVHDTLQEVLQSEPVAPRLLNASVPRDLETICLKCLAKEPARRYGSAQELAEEVERFLRGEPIQARPTGPAERSWRWCRRHPAVAALLGVVALALMTAIIGGVWHVRQIEAANREIGLGYNRLVQLRLDRVDRLLAAGQNPEAFATLALAVREVPTNEILVTRLHQTLTQNGFALPFRPSLIVTSGVEDLAIGLEGRRIAARSLDGFVRIWDAETGALLGAPEKFQDQIGPLVMSTDGRRLAAGGRTAQGVALAGQAGVWDLETGRLLHRLPHLGQVSQVSISADGRWLATVGGDGQPRIWDADSGVLAVELGGSRGVPQMAHRVSLSADGKRLATASLQGHIKLWDCAQAATPLRSWETTSQEILLHLLTDRLLIVEGLQGGTGRVRAVFTETGDGGWTNTYPHAAMATDISHDGKRLSLLLSDGTGHIVDIATGRAVGKPFQHPGGSSHARFSADGTRVATAGEDGTARVWEVSSGQMAVEALFHDWFAFDAIFSPDGQWLATAGMDGQIRFWKFYGASGSIVWLEGGPHQHAQAFDPAGTQLLVSASNSISLFDARSGRRTIGPLELGSQLRRAHFDVANQRLLAIGANGVLRSWRVADGQEAAAPFMTGEGITAACFSGDGTRLATTEGPKTVRTWSVLSRAPLSPRTMQWLSNRPWGNNVYDLVFSPDGTSVALASDQPDVHVWDAATGAVRGRPLEHAAPVVRLAFSPDGRRLATACMDFKVRLWDLQTGAPLRPELPHRATPIHVEFSRDGAKLLTAGQDKVAWIWDVATLQKLAGPMTHDAIIDMAGFSADGHRVATCGWDNVARVWDADTGLPLTGHLKLDGRLARVVLSPNGKLLAGAAMEGGARIWNLSTPAGPTPQWLSPLAEAVAGQRLREDGRFEPVGAGEFLKLREQLLRTGSDDEWRQWARRFLGAR